MDNFEKKIQQTTKNPKNISMQIVKLNNTDSISQSSEDQYCVLYNIQDPNPVITRYRKISCPPVNCQSLFC